MHRRLPHPRPRTAVTPPRPPFQSILKPNGLILAVGTPPGWYGGELDSIIEDKDADAVARGDLHAYVDDAGFSYKEIEFNQEYGTLEKIISTYGFIFGRKAIDYLRANNKTSIKWRICFFYKTVEK